MKVRIPLATKFAGWLLLNLFVLALGAARLDGSSRHAELVEARDDARRDDATRLT